MTPVTARVPGLLPVSGRTVFLAADPGKNSISRAEMPIEPRHFQ
jgi:hypothetical protein